MARELSKLPMFAIFLTLDHTASFFIPSIDLNSILFDNYGAATANVHSLSYS